MNKIKNICVFCGSSTNVAQKYLDLAAGAGTLLAQKNITIIYGGGKVGLMGALADAGLKHGAQVIGVLPQFLKDKEVAHLGLTALHLTGTMHERQMGMAGRADAFLVLPGGLGTLAEFFEILTWKQLGLHNKPIILVNAFGYWDSLLAFSAMAMSEKFLHSGDQELYAILETIEALEKYLERV